MQSKLNPVGLTAPNPDGDAPWPADQRGKGSSGWRRTFSAVLGQLMAMGTDGFLIGVLHPLRGMLTRRYSVDQVLKSLGWLRYRNRIGENIFVRPMDCLGTILLDDVSSWSVACLRKDGLDPSVIVETSPHNYQCWIRLIKNEQNQTISPELIHRVGHQLAREYESDPNGAGHRYGRLAGFTNRKPEHEDDGRFPFVKLRYAHPVVAPKGRDYLLAAKRVQRPRQNIGATSEPIRGPDRSYKERMACILEVNRQQSWARTPDLSRLDSMIVRAMRTEGVSLRVVAEQLLRDSPGIRERKAGHLVDYLWRTLIAAGVNEHPFSRQSLKDWLHDLTQTNPEPTAQHTPRGGGVYLTRSEP